MILWDWDLKHWYKPQYQVSTTSASAHMSLGFKGQSGNTSLFRQCAVCSPPAVTCRTFSSFLKVFAQAKYTMCKTLSTMSLESLSCHIFILHRLFTSCLNYLCNLLKNLSLFVPVPYRVDPVRTFFLMKSVLKKNTRITLCDILLSQFIGFHFGY